MHPGPQEELTLKTDLDKNEEAKWMSRVKSSENQFSMRYYIGMDYDGENNYIICNHSLQGFRDR